MRKNNHHSIPTTEVKSRVKMWHSGKNWVYGLLFFFGMAGISFGQANLVHADTTELSTETEKGTIASQLTDRAVPLQTSISKSADDSTTTATSDSEPDISGTNAEQTDATVEPSTAKATGSDTTDKAAPATDSETTTAGDQTESATTESPVSDPVNLVTTDATDTTGATDQADSSPATKSDATPVKEQSDSETASSSETATTTSPDETDNTETPTTDQTESSASSETSSTSETPVSDDANAPVTEDASSNVDTSSTPLPEVSYKSMLSAEQVAALAGTSEVTSAPENTSDPATTNGAPDQTTTTTNGLPEGFSVTDPDYPAGTFHHTVDDGSGLYSFFEGVSGGSTMVLSIDRETASEVHVETIANGKVATDHILETGEVYKGVSGYTVYAGKEGIDSVWVQPTGTSQNIIYDLYSYLDHTYNGGGYAVLKPFLQEQTTRYVDQNDKDVATSVTMTGLSRQKYTTGTPGSLSGYTSTNSGNTSGLMSPFMNNGQTFDEELYSSTGTDRGTLTYTVTDVDAGILAVSFVGQKGASITKAPLASSKDFATITGLTGITSYNVPYIFLNQTTSIKYKYAAESAKVDVNFVDENGNSLTPDDPTNSTLTMLYNEETEISPATIKGYTYNAGYQPTADDDPTAMHNPETYTVKDIDNPGKIILHYTANPEIVTVKHVDAKNTPIGTETEITGKYNETLTIASKDTSWIIDGYQAIGPDSYTFGDGDQTVTVHYKQTTKASINYVVDHTDGTTTNLDVTPFEVTTELIGVLGDSVKVGSPDIPGYTAVSTTPIDYTFAEDGEDVTLHYTANEVGIEVDFVDSQTGDTVRAPITQTVNPGAAVQIKLAGADHIPVLGYVFPQKKVPNGGTLEPLADGSIVINMTAPVDGVGKAIVYLDPTKTVDATDKPVSGASDSGPNKIYRLTNRVVTITTTTPDGSEYTATNGTQTVTYKRQYTYDVYIGPDSALTFGEWTVSGSDLAAIASADPDGYTKTITLSTNGGTPVTMTDDGTVNDQIQKDLTALLNLPKNGMLPNETTEAINITYTAMDQTLTVHFINKANNSEIGTQIFSGKTNNAIDFSALKDTNGQRLNKVQEGYVLVDDETSGLTTFAATDQDANIYYTPITGKYTITTPGGDVTEKPWTTDPDDPSKLAKVTVPTIENYTPVLDDGTPLNKDPNTGNYIIPVPTDPNASVNITYHEDTSSVTVDFTDYTDPSNAPWPSQTFSGEPGKSVTYSQDKNGNPLTKYQEGYLLLFDGTLDAPVYGSEAQTVNMGYMPIKGNYKITPIDGGTPEVKPFVVDPETPTQYLQQTIPVVEGYTAVIDHGDNAPGDIEVDPDDPTQYLLPTPTDTLNDVIIKYLADQQQLTVHFKMPAGSSAPADVSLTGESGSDVVYTDVIKSIADYVYVPSESDIVDKFDYDSSKSQTTTLVYKAVGDYTYTTPGTDTPTTTTYTTDQDNPSVATGTVPYVDGYEPTSTSGNLTPVKDADGKVTSYTFTPTDPTQPAEIKYDAKKQNLTVYFETADETKILGKVTLQGASGGPVDYSKVNKQLTGFILKTDGTLSTTKYDTDDGQDQSVILTYAALGDGVTVTTPTGEKTTTPYTNDSTEPKDPKAVDPITISYVPGYTPSSDNGDVTPVKDPEGNITGYTLIPTYPTKSTSVTYNADKKSINVAFVNDEDKQEIAGHPAIELPGVTDGTIDYTKINKLIDGYILASDGTKGKTTFSANDDGTPFTILYNEIGTGVTLTTPDPDNPSGQQTTKTYTNDPTDPSTVLPIDVPYIAGYTPTTPEEEGVVEPKDPKDITKGYTITPSNPSQPANVKYNADKKSIKVAFVNDEDKQEIAGHPAIELLGVTDETIDYTKINKLIDGYVLVNDGTKDKTTFAANDDGTPFTILYNEIGTGVTLTTPDPDDPNGKQITKTYTNDPENPSTVFPIDVPYIPGYTPTTPEEEGVVEPKDPKDLTKGYTFTPSNPSQPANVKYNADKKSINVAFVNNEDKQEIAGHPAIELPGVTDGTIDYTKINKLIDGYVLVNDGTKNKTTFAANDDGTPFTILYKEIGTGVTLTTPDPDNPDGRQTTKTYTNDPTDPSTVLPIDVPYIPGYTPTTLEEEGVVEPKDPKDITKGYTFTPSNPSQPANVKYNADSKNLNVVFVDQADPETPLKPTQNLIGVTDGDIDYTTVEKVIDGYVLLTDETAGKTKFTATDNGEKLTLTYQKTAGGYVGKTPAGVDLTTPYVTDPEDPKTVQPITIPTVPGYTLDIQNGKRIPVDDNDPSKGYTVTPINPSEPTTVTYTAETGKSVQVAYVDENGVEIAGHPVKTLSGQTDQTINYGSKAIAGYVLAADGTKDKTTFAADDDGTILTISYEKIVVTITKPTDDGNTETVPVDTTTPGHVDYIPGYTPKTDDGTALDPVDPDDETQGYKVPVPDDPTTKTTVNYDPDVQTVHVVLVDTAHHPVTNDEGQSTYTFHGVTGEGIHEWEVDKKAAAYTISDDGTLQKFVYDNDDAHDQVVEIIYLKTTAFNDPDGGTTTLLTDGSGKVVSIDKKWGTDGGDTNVLIENGIVTLTPNPDGTLLVLKTGVPDGDGTVTGTLGGDGNIILTQKTPTGTFTETITPDGQLSFSQAKVPEGVTATPEDYFEAQITHDPDGGTTTTKTNGNGDITAIDRNWPDGDHSHVVIAIDTGIATITETPAGGSPSEPVDVQPGTTATVGKTTLDNHDPINLTHAGTDGDSTIATITPDGKRTFTYTHTTDDPDGGKTTTTTNTDGDITTIDKDWGDGDHSHVDIDTGTGIATITETPAGGSPSEPITVQPGESGKNGKTTLDNGEPDGNIVLTHPGTDGDSTIATITPDGKRTFTYTHTTDDPDGGKTTTTTKTNGKITTIDKDWGDGDHSHVDIDTDTGVVTFTETPAGGSPSEPLTIQPSESGKNGKTTLDNGEPDGNIVLTHPGTDGGKTTETITPDTSRSFGRQPGGVSTDASHYFETQNTHDPDGGTTTTKTNGNGDITTIDKGWSDGDHSHVDINTETGIATITETPKGGSPSEPITVQPGESGKNGKTTLDNGEPDGNIVLTHQGTDGDKTTETITPDTSRSFSRQPGGVSTDASHYFETQVTHDPDGGTTTTKTNGDGNITTIDKDWSDGDHSHVDIDTGTGIATITETPAGGSPSEPITVQPGESGKNGKTTLDNGEPDGNIVLTHQDTDGDKTTETITPDTSRSFSRQPAGVQTTKKDYFETQITHDPDGGTTTTKTNGDGDITTIDKDWGDGDHSHVDIDTDTGIATITETPNGGEAGTPVEVQPDESGKNGKTALDNGEPDGNIVLTHQDTDGDKTTETITPDTSRSFSRQPGGVSTDASHYYETQVTHDPDGGTTTTKTNGDGDITTIDKDWNDGDHSHVDINTDTGIATITETPKGGSPSEPITVQPGESGKNGKTTLDNGKPDGNIVLTHQGIDGDKTTETITPDTSRSFSRQPGGVQTTAKDYFETLITHDPDGGTTTTKTNGDGNITTIDKDWGDGDHSHVDINTDTGIATITETPNGGEAGTPIEVQPGESGKNGKTTLDNGKPDGNIVLTHQGTDGDKTTETITPDTSRSFSRQPGGVSTDASQYYTTQVTHDPDGGTTTTKTNGDGDITTIDKDWGDGDHSHVDINTDTGIATITETPSGGEAGTPIEVQPGKSGKNGKTTLDNGEPDGNIVLAHQGTDGDKTTETITPDTSRSFSRQPGGVSTDASHYYTTQVTHDPDGGTTTTKTNGDGDITTIDKDWGDGDHSHVDIDTDTGIATITETPNGGEAGTPVEVQPGKSGKNGKTTLDNGEPDGNIVLTHQSTDGDKTTETIMPDTSRSFSRMPAPVFVTADDFYDARTTHDSDGGTTTTVTNGNGDVTTIDKDWGDGSQTHVTVDPNTGDATATDTDENGNTSMPVTVKPGETGTTGQTTITNGQPDGDIILSHEGTDGDQVEAAISDDGHVRVSLPDTDVEDKAETNVTVTSTPESTTSANHANLPQTSATSRTDVEGKKSTTTQLPETGDKQNSLGLIGATLLAGLAMLGFGKRRRDDED